MSDYVARLNELENNPRFAQLSYDKQVEARRLLLQETLPRDPRWDQMLPQDQQRTVYEIATRRPVFSEQPNERVQEIVSIADQIRTIGQTPEDQWTPEQAVTAGRAANLVSAARFRENSLLGKLLTKVSRFLPERAAENLNADVAIEALDTEDGRKATEYLSNRLSNNQQVMNGFQRFAIQAAPIAAMVTDIASGRVVANAPLKAARAASTARAATASRPWIFRSVLPELAESGLDGLLLTVNDSLENRTPQRTESAFTNTMLNFGTNVAADMAIFTGFSLLGAFGGMFRSTFKIGKKFRIPPEFDRQSFDTLIQAFDSGEAIPQEVLRTMPKEARDGIIEQVRLGQIGRKLPNVSEAELTEYTLATKGFGVERKPDGRIRLRNTNPARDIEYLGSTYANLDNALEAAVRYDFNVPDTSLGKVDLSLQNTMEVSQRIEAELPSGSAAFDRRTLAQAITPTDDLGSLNRRNVEIATQSILAKQGIENFDQLSVRQISDTEFQKLSSPVDVDNATIFIPEHIRTTADFQRFTSGLTEGIQKLVPEGAATRAANYVETLARRAAKTPDPYNPMYLEFQANKLGAAIDEVDGQYRVAGRSFNSVKEANDFLTMKNMKLDSDLTSAREAFGRQFGIAIVDEGDRLVARKLNPDKKGGTIIAQGSERLDILVNDLLQKGYTPKLFQSAGPDLIIDPSTSKLIIDGGTVRGPMQEIVKYSQKYFKKIDTGKVIQKLDIGQISRNDLNKTFYVKSDKYGVVDSFSSFDEAKEFLNSNFEDLKSLQRLGTTKGALRIRPSGDKLMVETIDEGIQTFDSVTDVRDYLLAKKVDPTYAKEISGIDLATMKTAIEGIEDPVLRRAFSDIRTKPQTGSYIEMSTGVKDIYKKARKLGPDGKLEPETFLGSAARTIEEITTIAGKVVGTPKYTTFRKVAAHQSFRELTDLTDNIRKQIQNSRGTNAVIGRLLEGVRRTPGVSDARRKQLTGFLERDPATWETAQKKLGVQLNAADRDFLDRYTQVSERLGTMFGIEPYKMMRNYLPDMRTWLSTPAGKKAVASSARAEQVLKTKYGSRIPKELEFFSKYMRATDLRNFTEEVDPLMLLEKYSQQGIKQFTLGAAYDEAIQTMNRWQTEGVPKETLALTYHYLEEVMGMYSDLSSKAMEELGTEVATGIAQKLGKVGEDQKVMSDFINMMQGFTVGATMSFRVWPIIRNLQQNWLTLAPRIGNDRVMKAMKKIMRDEDAVEKAYNHLLSTGRLQERIPVFGLETEGLIGKFNKWGMKFYKNSDHVNRIVAHFAGEDMLREAVVRYEAGITDQKKFLAESGINTFDPADQRVILETLENDGFDAALDRYGDYLANETHFTYAGGDNPALMSGGTWGRFFGQFGHWPLMFRQNVMNQIRRAKGDPIRALKFAGRLALNAAALTFTFEKVLGLRADSFKPHKAMFFGGGPYFGLTHDIMSQISGDFDAPGWASIRRDATRLFIPGSLVAQSALRSIDEFEKGNFVDGMKLLTGLPDLPDD